MQSWLLRAGMLRRNEHPAEAEMRELLPVAAARLTCPECEMHGLEAAEARGAEDADWPAARRCESCGAVISPERLEVFPHTELCPACQGRVDQGVPQPTDEFCDRCGSPLIVRTSTGRGITRQVLACSNPRCRRR
jgi:hypothetical protein